MYMEIKNEDGFDHIENNDLNQSESVWRRSLKGETAFTPLPIEKKSSRAGAIEYREQEALFTPTFEQQVKKYNLNLSTLLHGSWALLLSRYSGEENVAFESTIAAASQGLFSVYTSFLMAVTVTSEVSLLPWLKQLQQQWVALQAQGDLPDAVPAQSHLPPDTPLFESLLILSDLSVGCDRPEDQESRSEALACPLTIFADVATTLRLRIRYDRDRFEDAAITRMLGHLQTLLEGMVTGLDANPEQRLADIPWLTAAERHQLLEEWNNTIVDYPKDKCIHQVFEAQVERTPDAIAIVLPAFNSHAEKQLTYRELNDPAGGGDTARSCSL